MGIGCLVPDVVSVQLAIAPSILTGLDEPLSDRRLARRIALQVGSHRSD
ncbi:hypothetical protein H6F67_13210 [Microcoleus sp. FACHB-1515]|nr:hypothetical protein [Microcoleus sp. FACHB-1515]MBD2090809.1 hypothetical protein [Microcoleus sp. FACHB-1515]